MSRSINKLWLLPAALVFAVSCGTVSDGSGSGPGAAGGRDDIGGERNELVVKEACGCADFVNNTADTLLWMVATTKMCCDEGDGDLFYSVLGKPRHFKQYPRELHIFYNEGREYLKFERVGNISGDAVRGGRA